MGIRIHKVMGWGLQDVKCNDSCIVDPRFTPEKELCGVYGSYYGYVEEKIPLFPKWIEENMQEVSAVVSKASGEEDGFYKQQFEFHIRLLNTAIVELGHKTPDFFTHQGEYGLPKVVVFTPLDCPEWSRFDCTIDHYEAGCNSRNKVLDLTKNCGIYPYIGMMRIPGTIPAKSSIGADVPLLRAKMEPSAYNMAVGRWDKKCPPVATGTVLKDLLENYRPVIPEAIMALIYYLRLFKDFQKTVQEVRPMIYTYRS